MDENIIYIPLGQLIVEFTTATNGNVFISWPNRVPVPESDDFIYMAILNSERQIRNIHEYRDINDDQGDYLRSEEDIFSSFKVKLQIDCYGQFASIWAHTISTILRDARGINYLKARGVNSLYSDDVKNMTDTYLGSEQYTPRYMVEAEFQTIGEINLTVETFTEIEVESLKESGSFFPAQEE